MVVGRQTQRKREKQRGKRRWDGMRDLSMNVKCEGEDRKRKPNPIINAIGSK